MSSQILIITLSLTLLCSIIIVSADIKRTEDDARLLINDDPQLISVDFSKPGDLDPGASIKRISNDEAVTKEWKNNIKLGVYQAVGTRHPDIEDRFDVQRDTLGNNYFAVYDGHKGSATSSMLKEKAIKEYVAPVIRAFNEQLNDPAVKLDYEQLKNNLKQAILNLDQVAINSFDDGSTLNIVVDTKEYIVAINAGDSRSVVVNPLWQTFPLTEDHKPLSPLERERILKQGSYVKVAAHRNQYISRVNRLAMSRSIGDASNKVNDLVIGEPDVFIFAKNQVKDKEHNKVSMILVASDGIWDEVTNEQATMMIVKRICKMDSWFKNNLLSSSLDASIRNLGDESRRRGTSDDITIVAAILDNNICKIKTTTTDTT